METDTCLTCGGQFDKSTGKTELPICGHQFHPHCIHSFFRASSSCPKCPPDSAPKLDFGDNIHIANATREAVYAVAQANANNQKTGLSWITDKFKTKNIYPALCGPDDLVNWKAPIAVFLERGMTAKNLAESGVKLARWFDSGYSLADLQKLKVTWDDFVFMGFDSSMLKYVPVSFLVDVLKANISHLMQVGITHDHLIQAGYNAKSLLALQCTTHTLINMGLSGEQTKAFPISDKEWKILALQE